ncbi:MAG: hypothetical protein U0414_40135 [Polyangiaceae bacterium]
MRTLHALLAAPLVALVGASLILTQTSCAPCRLTFGVVAPAPLGLDVDDFPDPAACEAAGCAPTLGGFALSTCGQADFKGVYHIENEPSPLQDQCIYAIPESAAELPIAKTHECALPCGIDGNDGYCSELSDGTPVCVVAHCPEGGGYPG